MKSAPQVFRFDQARQLPVRRRLKLAAVLAQLRRDVIQIERAIQFRLFADRWNLLRRLLLLCFRIRWRFAEPIFIQRPAALQGPASDLDVVLLAPRKIIESERIFRRRDNAQVTLNSRAQTHTRFRRPLGDDRFDQRMLNEHHGNFRRRRGRHDEIEIAHDLLPAPITSSDANVERLGVCAQIVLQAFRFRRDLAELERARIFLPFVDRGAKFFLGRFAESGQFCHATGDARFV